MPFLNADVITAGLDPLGVRPLDAQAARLMLAEMERLTAQGLSFAFETTLSVRGYLRKIDRWRSLDYRVMLMFLALPSPEVAIERVRSRVGQGGHDVAEEVIRRRFTKVLANFKNVYTARVDSWALFDNSGDAPVIVEMGGWA